MAITSEIIGKLGGGGVDAIPVSGTASGNSGSTVTLATIDIPAGEQWLIAVAGTGSSGRDALNWLPEIYIGSAEFIYQTGAASAAATATGTINIGIRRNNSAGTDSFTGHVYTTKL